MKKSFFVLVLIASSLIKLWAINPPSYVGRQIEEVLPEIDGTKVRYNLVGTIIIAYRIIISDTVNIQLLTEENGTIHTVQYSRIYYNSYTKGNPTDIDMQRIFNNYVSLFILALGKPSNLNMDKDNKVTERWSSTNIGSSFMNPLIKTYGIEYSPKEMEIYEYWSSF